MISDGNPSFEAPLERDRQLDVEPLAEERALPHDPTRELDDLRDETELAEGGAGERRYRVERDVADQLQPELIADARLDSALQPTRGERIGDRPAPLGGRPVRLADRKPRPLHVPDDSRRLQLGRRIRDAADDLGRVDRSRHNAIGIDALEDRPLVRPSEGLEEPPRHAVLRRKHDRVLGEHVAEARRDLGQRVRLHPEDDDIGVGDRLEIVGRRDASLEVGARRQDANAAFPKRLELRPTRDQDDVGAAARERCPHVRADRAAAEDREPHQSSPKCSGIRRRCTLPVGVRGMLSTTWTTLGALNGATCSLQWLSTSASPIGAVATIAAPTICPYFASEMPYTTASLTAGWSNRAASTSSGEMFSPPRMISSLIRPSR